jgi:hypothetical protein
MNSNYLDICMKDHVADFTGCLTAIERLHMAFSWSF